ncbi:MAG: hypothetical protein Q7S45_01055 [Candidatus Curtissbacteria bacterium]|nr:hypothetical protein [Candidatus Curtissbacteria bacterium]
MQFVLRFFGELIFLFILSKILISDLGRLFYRVTKSRKWTVYFLAFVFLPGTIVHEMAHVFMAEILRVPVGDIELMPKIEGKGIKLGSVPVGEADPFRMFAIGAAPFLIGTILLVFSLALLGKLGFLDIWWGKLLGGYIVFEIGNTMFSSKRDMEGVLELVVVVAVVFGFLYFVGFRITAINLEFLVNGFLPVMQSGSKLMFVPIALDIAAILVLKFLSKLRIGIMRG